MELNGMAMLLIIIFSLVVNLVGSHYIAKWAMNKGYSYNAFFFVAFLASWLLAIIIIAVIPERVEQEERAEGRCPYCDELISARANICKHCHKEVEPLIFDN
jgi:biotin transporter BioY